MLPNLRLLESNPSSLCAFVAKEISFSATCWSASLLNRTSAASAWSQSRHLLPLFCFCIAMYC